MNYFIIEGKGHDDYDQHYIILFDHKNYKEKSEQAMNTFHSFVDEGTISIVRTDDSNGSVTNKKLIASISKMPCSFRTLFR